MNPETRTPKYSNVHYIVLHLCIYIALLEKSCNALSEAYGIKEKGGKQERMENMEAKNMPNGRTLTTTSASCSAHQSEALPVRETREKRAMLRRVRKEALGSSVNKVDRVEGRSWLYA